MENFQLTVKVRDTDLSQAVRNVERIISDRLRTGVNRLLQTVADTQILAYTPSSNPDRLFYDRTMTLRRASRIEPARGELPFITGRWYADEGVAPYAEEVLGPRSMQAPIHRDRWKSIEEVEEIVARQSDEIIKNTLGEIRAENTGG